MAADVQPINQVKLPVRLSSVSPEQKYWRSFKSPLKISSPTKNAITHISQPSIPSSNLQSTSEYFVVSTGARIQLYSTKTRKLIKTITRFEDIAYSGEIRPDGRVLVAGDNTGSVQVFDVGSRAILKTWKEQKQAVQVTKWNPKDTTSLMSCGDDTTVRLWDLTSDNPVVTFRGHYDYVRSGGFLPGQNSDLLVSGSYDQTVRLWDSRTPSAAAMTFKHAGPVEDVLCMPSGTTILTAAENQVAVLDIVAGKPMHVIKNHQKTVTSLCLASQNSRLVTGGLDGHMKVFETTGWNATAGSKYSAPILSLSVISAGTTREDKHIAVGMSDGQLSIRTKLSGEARLREREREKEMEALLAGTIEQHDKKKAKLAKQRGKGWEKRMRGRSFTGEDADIIIEGDDRTRRRKFQTWDRLLHATRYGEALDAVLATKDKDKVFSVLTNLRYRGALRAALENRDEATLAPILRWVLKYISTTSLVPICVELTMNVMDLYAHHIGPNDTIQPLVETLHTTVKEEADRAQQAIMTKGMLELLVPEFLG